MDVSHRSHGTAEVIRLTPATERAERTQQDPLRDEAVEYARRLMAAGVATELHVFPGTCHGFDAFVPDWEMSQQLFDIQGTALRRALHA